jgi:hypothetical protein
MKSHRFAAATLAALFSLAACAENPVAPASDASNTVISQSFARGAARSYTFTTVDFPGAFQTAPSGINAGGVIVGWYFQGIGCPSASTCVVRGFSYNDGVFTTVVYHNAAGVNAAFTQLRGIGPSGEIVGLYRMAGEPVVNLHGFMLTRDGEFVEVKHPDHTNSVAQRILPDGTILGCYHDNDQMGSMHGMLWNKDGFSAFSMATTMHNGATPSGHRITGLFTDMSGKGRAYVLEDGVFTPFDAPNSVFTAAWDMSPSGTIVGLFQDAALGTHGFVLDRGQFTTIDYPGSTYTDAFGINASGNIVGKYRVPATGVAFHGYVATPN